MNVKDTRDYYLKIQESAKFVNDHLGHAEIAVVLGSGLNNFTEELTNAKELHYGEIPNVPQPTVKGHSGKLIIGEIGNKKIFCLAGRSHAYEGRHAYELTFLTRVLKLAGCKLMISTNASGGALDGMYPGCLMIINDHINFYKRNPLSDSCEFAPLGPHHADLTAIYSKRLAELARSVGERFEIKFFEGIYGGTAGPTYETPSEVKAFSSLGAGAFGMSTMPETMAARSIGLESFAISLITNLASGLTNEVLTHTDVTHVAAVSGPAFIRFMKQFLVEVQVVEDKSVSLELAPFDDKVVVIPLPQHQHPSATHRQMDEAVAFVRNVQKENTDIAVLISEGQSLESITLSNKVEVPYLTIPHFPATTASRNGKLVFGTSEKSRRVVILAGHYLEGFNPEESTFITELLYHLGVKVFVQTFIAGTTSEDDKLNEVVVLTDCLDTTTIHPFPRRIKGFSEYQTDRQLFNQRFIETLKSDSVVTGTYCHQPGPSYPTAAEVRNAKQLDCKSVGMTSTFCLYSARALNMEVVALAENSYYKPLKELKSTTNIMQTLNQFLNTFEIPEKQQTVEFEDIGPVTQITNHLAPPVIQGFYDQILEAAHYIKDQMRNTAAIGLVIDSCFQDTAIFNELVVKYEINLNQVPHMSNQRGKFICGELEGVKVYILQGTTMNYVEGVSSAEAFSFVRLLAVLDAKKMIFVSPIVSVDESIKVGDITILKDHVLLSGRSPLFGPNEERWGTRFPDVGEAYNVELQEILMKNATKAGMNLKKIIYGHVVGPIFNSQADATFATRLNLQALSVGLAPEVLVARHMGVCVGAVGVAVASMPTMAEKSFKCPENLCNIVTKTVKEAYKM